MLCATISELPCEENKNENLEASNRRHIEHRHRGFNVLGAIGLIIAIVIISGGAYVMRFLPPADAPFIAPMINTILAICLVITIIQAVLPIIGGVFALQRRRWGWALAGSIIAILGMFPLGVAATVLVSLAKEEFEPQQVRA